MDTRKLDSRHADQPVDPSSLASSGNPAVPHAHDAPADPVRRSWVRCMDAGLQPEQHLPEVATSRSVLSERLEANERLVAYAQPVIENLHQQICRSSSMVLLADNSGMILRSVGDSSFVERATRVSLAPGAIWSEAQMGTNAIGTAIEEQRSVAVFGEQHYLHRNRFLTCISTPILNPLLQPLVSDRDAPARHDGLLGILDISSDARLTQVHAQALLLTTAETIENRLLDSIADSTLTLRFHCTPEAIGTPLEGIAAFNELGELVAINRRARQLLQQPERLYRQPFSQLFATPWSSVVDAGLRRTDDILPVHTVGGRAFLARASLRMPARPRPRSGDAAGFGGGAASAGNAPCNAAAPRSSRTLHGLDLGDTRMAEAIRRAERIVEHDIPLLIQGETGTGKEIFAQAFHATGPRRDGPFVAVNCAAIPATLIEAELFGYVEGAYTGAKSQGARGKLREANGGILFLDEIGDMPLALQAVLLRVLETRRVTPLGGGDEEAIDIALVCASHHPLRDLMTRGTFRADLFFRLSGMTVALPPLRERSDFNALVRKILIEECPRQGIRVSPEALAALTRHAWPGNLRQLRNVLRLAIALLDDSDLLQPEHLPQEITDSPAAGPRGGGSSQSLRAAGIKLVQEVVNRHGGNISAAARELGITRTTLYRKLRQRDDGA
jgi:transcriptional regulator of acetoin/glycerol metabolism